MRDLTKILDVTSEDAEGEDLLNEWYALATKIQHHQFPPLVVEEVTDDGETFIAVRCPHCGLIVSEGEELVSVDWTTRYTRSGMAEDVDTGNGSFPFSYDRESNFESLH